VNPGTREVNLLNQKSYPSEQGDQKKDKGNRFPTNRGIRSENNIS